jgi:hypothetical protein
MHFSELDLLLVHAFATCAMAGLIGFVQIVHYPLFARVGAREFGPYHERHTGWTALVVAPLMGIEMLAATRIALAPPAGVDRSFAWSAFAVLLAIWLATAGLSVPLHARLAAGRCEIAIRRLVATNWIRTVGWFARSLAALCFVRDHVAVR